MAITHADLAPKAKSTELGSKAGAFLMVLSILCGLCCFILCLMAEATRSQVTWESTSSKGQSARYLCVYSGSGKAPLLCAAGAFLVLAIAMVVEHTYMLVAISKTPPPALLTWESNTAAATSSNTLTLQAAFFFIATWVCFAVGEILLLIGVSVESGHLSKWSIPRPSCLIIQEGLFTAAGIFALITIFLAAGLYLTALRAQRLFQEQENVGIEVMEASILYASPPRQRLMSSIAPETPIVRQNLSERTLSEYLSNFDKHSSLV